ncbi:MAG: hypothetical protein KDK76_03315 [Chlamydiia bacterium]|nr:hypothetical protein [Chlamydiia bacterium]
MERIGRETSYSQIFYSCVETLVQRVDEYACLSFQWINDSFNPPPSYQDVERYEDQQEMKNLRLEEMKNLRLVRDLASWESIKNPIKWVMNLTSGPDNRPVIQLGGRNPFFVVRLPRRQHIHLPEPIKNKLLNIPDDSLDIFFAIYDKPNDGSDEFNLTLPQLNERGNEVSVGFYGGTGIERGRLETVPWHFIRRYSMDGGDHFKARLTGEVGAFTMGAYASDCRGPYRGIALYGLVLSQEGRGTVLREALRQSFNEKKSLETFVQFAGDDLPQIFTFNNDY